VGGAHKIYSIATWSRPNWRESRRPICRHCRRPKPPNHQAVLARSYFYLGEFEDAEKQARAAYEGRLILFGHYDLKTLGIEKDLGACLAELGQIEETGKRL
jgi:hypothetical protein